MDEFIKNLPKIELHAHLNGSLSNATLKKLVDLKKETNPDYDDSEIIKYSTFTEEENFEKCFEKFKFAHDLVDTVESVKLAVSSVIDEFSKENVIYLELRSTPRETATMTKEEYLEAIIEQIIICEKTHPHIIVKYLPSINISYGAQIEGEKNFQLFSDLRKKYPQIVVGIDLSGNPEKGKFNDFHELFKKAREEGFRFAIHCAESIEEHDVLAKLEFMTSDDRIGHGTFISESNKAVWDVFTSKHIPIEICLTSNVLCRTVPSYKDHHISRFIRKHPIMICTDDYGVFQTTLTRELTIAAETYGLSKVELVELTENANRYSFARSHDRQLIRDKIEEFKKKMFSH